MNFQKIIEKYRYIIIGLLITYFIFIICYFQSAMGLFFDIPAMFSAIFYNQTESPNSFQIFFDERIRFFSNFLIAIPYNLIFQFIKNEPALTALKVYSTSYLIIHILLLVANYFVAKRTKRYDIFLLAFSFYFLLTIPNIIWVVREIHIAFLLYFIVLSYFLSKEKLKKYDLIPIIISCILLYEIFETSALFGLILFIASIIFAKNKELSTNNVHKIIIGILSLAAFIYITTKLFIWNSIGEISLSNGSAEWISHSELAIKNVFTSNLLIPLFAICALIILCFYKKTLTKKIYICGTLYLFFTIFTTYLQTNFLSRPLIELVNYSPIFWFIFPTIVAILICEYLKIDLNKKNPNLYEYLIIVTCVFGILNLAWQIKSTFDFSKYKQYLEKTIKESESTLVKIPNKDFEKKEILRYATCFGFTQQSIFLTEKNKKAKIILPTKECPIYTENYCEEGPDKTYYDEKEDRLILQSSFFKTKTKYWDLTPIVEEFKKEGRVK